MQNAIFRFFVQHIITLEQGAEWANVSPRAARRWVADDASMNSTSFRHFWNRAYAYRRELVSCLSDDSAPRWTRPASFMCQAEWQPLLFTSERSSSRFMLVYLRAGVIYEHDVSRSVPPCFPDPEEYFDMLIQDVLLAIADFRSIYDYSSQYA